MYGTFEVYTPSIPVLVACVCGFVDMSGKRGRCEPSLAEKRGCKDAIGTQGGSDGSDTRAAGGQGWVDDDDDVVLLRYTQQRVSGPAMVTRYSNMGKTKKNPLSVRYSSRSPLSPPGLSRAPVR